MDPTRNLEKLTMAVVEVARQAGALIKQERLSLKASDIKNKNPHDYVTKVDKLSEAFLIDALRGLLPSAGFIIEEMGATWEGEPYAWVVDPLDGTTNFIHDMGSYCVCIALRDESSLLLGVVFDPVRDECFYCWKGAGASYNNGVPIRVSKTESFQDALVITELPYNSQGYHDCAMNLLESFMGNVAAIRMTGSAALAICYVACGRVDAWMEAYLGRWDFSAAALILMEAGGRMTDFLGREDFLDGHHVVATNALLHEGVLDILSKCLPEGIK